MCQLNCLKFLKARKSYRILELSLEGKNLSADNMMTKCYHFVKPVLQNNLANLTFA